MPRQGKSTLPKSSHPVSPNYPKPSRHALNPTPCNTSITRCASGLNNDYDALNRPRTWEQAGPNGFHTLSHHYYDEANREKATWRDEDQKGERFAYEPTNQLAGVAYNAPNVSAWPPPFGAERTVTYAYTPDKLNRSTVTDNGVPTNYTPNGLNQYTAVGGTSHSYDSNFNLTAAGSFFGTYNAANQLVAASNSGSTEAPVTVAGFVYDGLGRCVKRTLTVGTADAEATVFVYDGWKPIGEFDAWGNFQAWNVYGPGADEILLRQKDGIGYTLFLLDRHGNVAFLVDNDGHLLEKYTYDVFGRPTIVNMGDGETKSSTWYIHNFLFQGREYISQLGVYDYRNRFYFPELGRFLQTDPTGFDAGDMNLFRYCGDDPWNRSDPTGLTDIAMSAEEIRLGVQAALNARANLIKYPERGPGRTQYVVPGPNGHPMLEKGFARGEEPVPVIGKKRGSNLSRIVGYHVIEKGPKNRTSSGHVHDDAGITGEKADLDYTRFDRKEARGSAATNTRGKPVFKSLTSDSSTVDYLVPQTEPGKEPTKHKASTKGLTGQSDVTAKSVEPESDPNAFASLADGYNASFQRFRK